MEQEQTNQNQAGQTTKSSSGQALLALGSNECGQFSAEDKSQHTFKSTVPLTKFFTSLSRQIYSVACGAMHTLILTTNGEVYSFGVNDDGALGRTGNQSEPIKVDLEVPVDLISAGESHSVACNSAHALVFQWGAYKNNQKGNISKSETPLRIGEDEFKKKKVKQVISGANHTLALVDGKIYAWGDPEVGILGRLSTSRRKLDQGLKIEGMGVKGAVEEIYTGANHAFLKKTEKKKNETYTAIFAWGLNNCGQLGIGNTENQHNPVEVMVLRDKNIKNITGGEHHTLVLTEDGEVYSFGKNDGGELGLGQDFEEPVEEEEEVVEEEKKKTPAKPAKPPAKSTSKKGKGKGKKGGNQKKGEENEEEKGEEKEEGAEKKDEEENQDKEKEGEEKPAESQEAEKEKTTQSQEAEAEKKDEEKDAEEVKEPEPEKKITKSNSIKKKKTLPENGDGEEKKPEFKIVKTPQKVELANVEKIFSGSQFNYAATKEQEIYSWGTGAKYVLGTKNEDPVYKPAKLEGDVFEGKRIVVLGLGAQHVIAFGVDKDSKDPELEEEAFAKGEEQSKLTRKNTLGKKGEKKGKGKEEANDKDLKKTLTSSLSLEEETEEKEDEKNKKGQKKSLKRRATDEGEEENGVKKVKKSPSPEKEPAAAAGESKMEEEAPKATEGEEAGKEDAGKMEEEKPAENKEEPKAEEKAEEPAQPVEEKVDEPQAEGEKKEENKEGEGAEAETKAQEGTA